MKQILVNDRVEYDIDIASSESNSIKSVSVRYSESSDWSKPGDTMLTFMDTSEEFRIIFPNGTTVKIEYYEMPALLGAMLLMKEDKVTITQQTKILEV